MTQTPDEELLKPSFGSGETVWTYARRFTPDPEPVQAVVLDAIHMQGHYPPIKYVVQHNGILCLRDDFTMAHELHDIPVQVQRQISEDMKEYVYDD